MRSVLVTYCSRAKRRDDAKLPAWQRYLSERIVSLVARAREEGRGCLILSGKYGLIDAEEPVPYYDHLLVADEVEHLVEDVVGQLRRHGVEAVEYHTVNPDEVAEVRPYRALIHQACVQAGVGWEEKRWDGPPD
jgi:hypothetical protein